MLHMYTNFALFSEYLDAWIDTWKTFWHEIPTSSIIFLKNYVKYFMIFRPSTMMCYITRQIEVKKVKIKNKRES